MRVEPVHLRRRGILGRRPATEDEAGVEMPPTARLERAYLLAQTTELAQQAAVLDDQVESSIASSYP